MTRPLAFSHALLAMIATTALWALAFIELVCFALLIRILQRKAAIP
ncbi:hypothetical protein [Dongia sp.]